MTKFQVGDRVYLRPDKAAASASETSAKRINGLVKRVEPSNYHRYWYLVKWPEDAFEIYYEEESLERMSLWVKTDDWRVARPLDGLDVSGAVRPDTTSPRFQVGDVVMKSDVMGVHIGRVTKVIHLGSPSYRYDVSYMVEWLDIHYHSAACPEYQLHSWKEVLDDKTELE